MNTAVGNLVVSNLKGPLGDLRVRKALMMALDRPGIIAAANAGYGEVSNAHTTKSVWVGASEKGLATAFDGLAEYPRDLDAAKKLVEEAGATGQEITYVTAPIGNDFSVISQATAAAAESIGLKVTIKTVTPNAYTALFSDPSAREGVDLFYTSWYLSSPDPLEMYSVLRTGDFSNYGGWSDPDFDRIIGEAAAIDDPAKRSEKTAEAQRIANRAAAVAAALHRTHDCVPGQEDHRRRPVHRLPLLPLGGNHWLSLAFERPAGGGVSATARRVAGKLGGLLLTLFLASLLVFFSRFLVPGDPVSFLLRGRKPSPEAVADVTRPVWPGLAAVAAVLQLDHGRAARGLRAVHAVPAGRLDSHRGAAAHHLGPGGHGRTDDRRRRASSAAWPRP